MAVKFVAVGLSGAIRTSSDAASWSSPPSGTAQNLVGVARGNGLWVAVGNGGAITRSADGVTWTAQTFQGSVSWRGVAYGNGLWVVTSSGDNFATSTDGVTWTNYSSGGPSACEVVAFAAGVFVAVGTSGSIYTSTNGTSWTLRKSSAGDLRGVAYGSGVWVAVDNDANQVWRSTDNGVTWASATGPGAAGAWAIAYGADTFVVGADTIPRLSSNGLSWSNGTGPLYGSGAIGYGSGLFINAGGSGVRTSVDGDVWSAFISTGGSLLGVAAEPNSAPNAPSPTAPADASTIDRNSPQRFDWNFSDPDAGDTQSAYNFRYRAVGAPAWTETGWVSTPSTYRDVAGGTFADATDYEWQVATKDAQGVEGPFSASSFFTAASPSAPATITYPTSGGTVDQADRVDWSAPTQESYQVRRVADNAGAADTATVYYDSGEVVSATARSHALDFATNDRYEHVQVRIKEGGLWSAWSSVRVLVSYTPPPTPTVTPGADDSAGAVVLTYSTPAPAAGEPTVEYADVEVRDTSGRDRYRPAEGIRIGALLTPSGTFIDWLPAAGVNYEYRVVAFGDNGTTSASEWTPIDAEAAASVYYATY